MNNKIQKIEVYVLIYKNIFVVIREFIWII